MSVIERVSNLNSNITSLNNDYDFSAYQLWLSNLAWGVLFSDVAVKSEFELNWSSWDITITSGKAIIVSTRATSSPIINEKIGTIYELSGTKTLTGTGTKVFIEIDQTLIDDPTLIEDTYPSTDYALGKNIAELKRESTYPTVNSYIKLWEYSGVLWTDVRDYPKVNWQKVDLSNLIWDISTIWDLFADNGTFTWNLNANRIFSGKWDIQQQIDEINVDLWLRYSLENEDLITWEALTKWDSLFPETWPTFIEALTALSIGDDAWRTRRSIKQIGSWVAWSSLYISLAKVVSPSVPFGLRLETDSGWNPSWILIDANAVASVDASNCSTNFENKEITFSWTPDNNLNWVTLDDIETSQTIYKGLKVNLTKQVSMLTAVVDSDCTATKAYLFSKTWILLEDASITSSVATFTYPWLVSWEDYYLLAGSDWAEYSSVKQTGVSAFPYVSTSLDYTSGITAILWYTPTANTVAYYSLNWNANDSWPNLYNLTASNVSWVTWYLNDCASFGWSPSKIVGSINTNLTEVSIRFRVKMNSQVDNVRIIDIVNANSELAIIQDTTTPWQLGFLSYPNGNWSFFWYVNTGIANGTWFTVTLVAWSNYNKIYINGIQKTASYHNGSASSWIGNITYNWMSIWATYAGILNLNWFIDEVVVENVGWTDAQVLADYNSVWAIFTEDEEVYNFTNITTSDTVLIPRGTPYHIVMFQGTYGSETINSTNYYKIWSVTTDTSCRWGNIYDWSAWGTINSLLNCYVSTVLSEATLLSKTDWNFDYKLPDIPRIATANYGIWDLVKYNFDWFDKSLTGLTKDADYYVSDTPWALSTVPWTLGCIVAKAKATDELFLNKKAKKLDCSITVWASPFSYKNTTGGPIQIKTTAGTVSDIKIRWITVATATSDITNLTAWDTMVVTYSSKPTMVYSEL